MRLSSRWLAPPPLALLLLAPLPSSAIAASEADSAYSGYRIPDHRWWQLAANVNAGGSRRSSNSTGFESRDGSLTGRAGARVFWGFDSDPTSLSLGLRADVLADRSHHEVLQQTSFYDLSNDAGLENLRENFNFSGSWRRYPWGPPVGFTLATNNNYMLFQRFESSTRVIQQPGATFKDLSSSGNGEWRYAGVLAAGFGFGRVRDVTPVYQAQVLEDRLRRSGALGRALSHAAREKLAALFTTEGAVAFAHQRPSKYFWEQLERVLREDGALERGWLDAYSAQRVLEPILPTSSVFRSVFRRRGFFIGPAVALGTDRSHLSREESFSSLYYQADTLFQSSGGELDTLLNDRSDDVSTSLVAEYHQPLGTRWQLDAASDTRLGEAGAFVASSAALSVSYMVSDRWVGGMSVQHMLRAPENGSTFAVDSWAVSFAAELHYFLEDSWSLSLQVVESQAHSRDSFARSGSFQLGITRLFSGLFELPGIASTMRPTPPLP